MTNVTRACQEALKRSGCENGSIMEYATFKAWTILGLSDREFIWLTYHEAGPHAQFRHDLNHDMTMCPFDDPHIFVPFHWATIVRRCALNGIIKIVERSQREFVGLTWQKGQFTNSELLLIIND